MLGGHGAGLTWVHAMRPSSFLVELQLPIPDSTAPCGNDVDDFISGSRIRNLDYSTGEDSLGMCVKT
jgi:hypothetical protein